MSVAQDPLVCPLTTWTVDQLKDFLRDRHLPVTGVKLELVNMLLCSRCQSELCAHCCTFAHFGWSHTDSLYEYGVHLVKAIYWK